MLQYKSSQMLGNLSWEIVGKTIVNTVAQLPNIDIAILYVEQLSSNTKQYFFGQKELEACPVNRELLKLTVLSGSECSLNDNIIIHQYQEERSDLNERERACISAKIRSSILIPLFNRSNFASSLTLHRFQDFCRWSPEDINAAKMMASQANLIISQVLVGETLKESAQRETTINRITTTIRSSLEPPVMFAAIAKELGSALDVDGCTLSLWTKSDRFVRCVGLYNPHEPQKIIPNDPNWQQETTSSVPISENPILQALLYTKKPVSDRKSVV